MGATKTVWRRDLAITSLCLLLLAIWEFSGLDLPLVRQFGSADGFYWREAWLTSTLLHEGGRALGWAVLIWQLCDALWVRPKPMTPSKRERLFWISVAVANIVLVPALKRVNLTSCPWELSEFGGIAHYVPHWLLGVYDGGPGHCFPSGHAIAAFGFFGLYFLWRPYRPTLARVMLGLVIGAGAAFGLAQMARGAHYLSHTLWSGFICWTLCIAADYFARARAGQTARQAGLLPNQGPSEP
ncbi:phosphatase PAP2 family protein [Roseateles oligotrophus]|uniref:Phosphatase PAP2 family protein n=1 Tax=Roseateles oligotrophus TaxID=1769250 RepID=A0ABT2YLU8_9BURK|nr:phosphatase PAP2 family protein [Roseateles oligotrophus]MCV2371034.1 phosphatase PAP2 family protein [Roseateles oligotrophus]